MNTVDFVDGGQVFAVNDNSDMTNAPMFLNLSVILNHQN